MLTTIVTGWWLQTFLLTISYLGCHPSHWRTHIFQNGLKPPTRLSAKAIKIKTTSHSASDLHLKGFGAITRQQSIAVAAQREGRWTVDHLGLSCLGNTSGGIAFIHRYTHTYIYRWKVHKYSDVTFRNWDQKPANNWDLASNNRDWD